MEVPGEEAENFSVASPKAEFSSHIVEISSSSEKSSTGKPQETGEEATSTLRRSASQPLSFADRMYKRPRLQFAAVAGIDTDCAHSNTTASNFADGVGQIDVLAGGNFHTDGNGVTDGIPQSAALEGRSLRGDGDTAVDADVEVNNDDLPDDFLEPLDSPLASSPPPIMHLDTQGPQHFSRDMAKVMFKQFWKAGDFDTPPSAQDIDLASGMEHIRVHPKFLHSNATSHKWALGAIAELLDNALDEAVNGATFVNVDMVRNPRDWCPMLVVEDNGGGMDPECMRQCMSLGFSAKSKVANTIGQYGNGFKTSTMRLGADVVVFSRKKSKDGSLPTQSIGLLSYTFLMATGQDDTIVPMVDYEVQPFGLKKLVRGSLDDWNRNLEMLLQWSPYNTEQGLLDQLQRIKDQGTIVVIFNLWEDDEGELELDFDADPFDIQLRGTNRDDKSTLMASKYPHCKHFFTHKFSLRSYASILYLRLPKKFMIILRGKQVIHHKLVSDLMLVEQVKYKPKVPVLSYKDAVAVVTLGFVKDAKEHIDIQGFNVYHKNRLIRPFWRVWINPGIQGRGIIGVLEANFVEPAHDKQGFERTTVFARLETRLIEIQKSYWSRHCEEIGYVGNSSRKKGSSGTEVATIDARANRNSNPATLSRSPTVKHISVSPLKDILMSPSSTKKTRNTDLVVFDEAQKKAEHSNPGHSVSALVKEALPSQHTKQFHSTIAVSTDQEQPIMQTDMQSEGPRRSDRLKTAPLVTKSQTTEEIRVQGTSNASLPATNPAQSCSVEFCPRNHNDSESQNAYGSLGGPRETNKSISRGIAEADNGINQIVKPACLAPEFDSDDAQQTICEVANKNAIASASLKDLECNKASSSDGNQANHVSELGQTPVTLSAGGQLVLDVSGPSLQAPIMSESLQDSNEALISPSSQCDRPESSQCTSRNAANMATHNGRPRTLTRSMLQLRQCHAKAAQLGSASLQQIQQPMLSTTTDVSCLAQTTVEDGDPSVTTLVTPVVDQTNSLESVNVLQSKLGVMKQRLRSLQSDLSKINRERDFLKGELEEERRRQLRVEDELKKRLQALSSKAAELEAANMLMQVCQR